MASIEPEIIDPSAAIEGFRKAASELALSRRSFMGMGVAGAAAAGVALLSAPGAAAQEPVHNGFPEVDVLNFLLQVKYLTATLYSYVTQGTDLPQNSGATIGSAQVYNQPAKITFSTQQITDLFNEMYYDELSHVIDLRNLIESASAGQPAGGTAVASRPNLDLSGTSTPGKAPSSSTETLNPLDAVALAQSLEDLSVTACAGALVYLSGTNLAYVTQMMASDGFHSGAIRLVSIQTGAPYRYRGTLNLTFTAGAIAGSTTLYAFVDPANPIQVGYQVSTGPSIAIAADANANGGAGTIGHDGAPSAAGSGALTVTAVGTIPSSYSSGYATKSTSHHLNVLTDVPAALAQTWAPGMPVFDSGKYFPNPGTYIVSITPNAGSNPATYTVEMSASSGGHTPGTISVGTTPITVDNSIPNSGAYTATTIGLVAGDPNNVLPADIGAGVATTGPAHNPPGVPASPVNQGFFDTAGSVTASGSTPAGLAFARNFSQVLSVLYNYSASTTNSNFEGGFFPFGVGGTINSVQPT